MIPTAEISPWAALEPESTTEPSRERHPDVPLQNLGLRRPPVESFRDMAQLVQVGLLLYPETPRPRPQDRSECRSGPRPCPYVSCRHHLALDVTEAGTIRWSGEKEIWDLAHSCALDVADQGPATLQQISNLLGVTREMVRQIERRALATLERRQRHRLAELRVDFFADGDPDGGEVLP